MAVNIGSALKLFATVRAVDDQRLVDPTTLTLFINKPDTTTVTIVWPTDSRIVRAGVGQFFCVLTLDQSGQWNRQWEAAGSSSVVSDDEIITVVGSQFIPG